MNTSLHTRSRKLITAAMVLLLITFSAASGWSQTSPTTSSPPAALVTYPVADPIIYIGSGGLVLASHFLEARKPKPDIASLSPADIPSFDRLWYSTHRSEPLSIASDVTLAATVFLPVVMIPQLSRSDLTSSIVVYGEALALSYGLKSLVKGLVVRYRPYAYAAGHPASLLTDPEIEDSFPSGHVTVAFAAAVAAGYIADLYSSSTSERAAMWGTALGLASATAVFRVWSGNHFLSDVVAAAAIGSLVGVVLPFVHSPRSLVAAGLSPAVRSVVPAGGVPILKWDIPLP